MANRVHPAPTDADNSSGSPAAACIDWRIGDADSMSARAAPEPTTDAGYIHTWTPPVCKAISTSLASRRRLQTYIRPSDARGASALMECAGWLLNKTASSKLGISVRFDQPRSYLYCHQRSIAKATCYGNLALKCAGDRRLGALCHWHRYMTWFIDLASGQQRPRKPRVLVGHRYGGNVMVTAS